MVYFHIFSLKAGMEKYQSVFSFIEQITKMYNRKKLKYCILHHMPYNSQTVLDLHQSQDGSVAEWLQLDSGTEGHGFKSQPRRCRVTVLGKLFIPIVPLFTPNSKTGSSPEGNCRPGGK